LTVRHRGRARGDADGTDLEIQELGRPGARRAAERRAGFGGARGDPTTNPLSRAGLGLNTGFTS
jgi:hypothetical protein